MSDQQSRISRRSLAKTLGGAALTGSALTSAAEAQSGTEAAVKPGGGLPFPEGFLWGCATAAYQVEGGAREGGRGPSIWDTFSHTPGKTKNGMTGDVADDEYHRYKQDIELMKSFGVKAYRFSVSWPRIFPQGTGQPNQQGVDYYKRVVDELLANDIQPFCTLFHWDLPQALQDKNGGWQSRDTAQAFAEYAGYITGQLADKVKHFFTINEFSSFIDLGYRDGQFAPGLRLTPGPLNQTRFNAVLAHGLAVQAMRAKTSGVKIGLAENLVACVPIVADAEHTQAAERATRILNAPYLTVIMEGKYPQEWLEEQGANAPKFTDQDLTIISSPLDFLGTNVYTATYIRSAGNRNGFEVVKNPTSYPHMLSDWLYIGPEALYWVPRNVHKLWNVNEIYITENGCSSADTVAPDGHVYDSDRIMYLRNYLTQLQRSVAEGSPVKGYFLWSLLDNFEWASGYTLRFGIVYVDFQTQKRTPKMSASFYQQTIAGNAVA